MVYNLLSWATDCPFSLTRIIYSTLKKHGSNLNRVQIWLWFHFSHNLCGNNVVHNKTLSSTPFNFEPWCDLRPNFDLGSTRLNTCTPVRKQYKSSFRQLCYMLQWYIIIVHHRARHEFDSTCSHHWIQLNAIMQCTYENHQVDTSNINGLLRPNELMNQ